MSCLVKFSSWLPALLIALLAGHALAQAPPVKQWDRSIGGSGEDAMSQVRQTPDGGYIMAGLSNSGVSGDKSEPAMPNYDYWVVKVDANGQKQWDRTYGGQGFDNLSTVRLTPDGGYLLAGYTWTDADGDKSQPSNGLADYWIVKLDAKGNKQWDRAFGGRGVDYLSDVWPTRDGGYLLGGRSETEQSGDHSQPSLGVSDMWIVKIDGNGTKQWDRVYGGPDNDYLSSLQQTADGGYILGGWTYGGVSAYKSQPSQGEQDYWLVKIDEKGTKQWDRAFGGTLNDHLLSLQQTTDGGYILGGWSNSPASRDKTESGSGWPEFWIIKTDAAGTKQWDRVVGRVQTDYLSQVQQTTDGGYILGGEVYFSATNDYVNSFGGNWDYWIAKLDAAGTRQWDRVYGGSGNDNLTGIQQTADGGYILGGVSTTRQDGDKSDLGKGGADFWLVKLGVPRIEGDPRLCTGGQVTLTAPAGAKFYQWSTGEVTPSITVTQAGLYSVVCTYADQNAITVQQQVSTYLPPTPTITGDLVLCAGASGQLIASADGATSYRWNTGATSAAVPVTESGEYTVVATFANGCTSEARLRVRQLPAVAPFTLGGDTTLCDGASMILRAPQLLPGAGPVSYRWSDGSTAPTLQVQAAGTYALTMTGCGSQTASRRVEVRSCTVISNIITPNGDGKNDRWQPMNLPRGDWALTIYNRWGRQVYATAAYHNEWGEAVAGGTYYYLLRQPTSGQTYKGWVEVVR